MLRLGITLPNWPLYLPSNNSALTMLHCETCGCSSHETSVSSFCPSKIFLIEFASDVIDQKIPFYDTITMLLFNYDLKSLVRCKHNHFTCVTRHDNIGWLFIDDLSDYVSVFQSANEALIPLPTAFCSMMFKFLNIQYVLFNTYRVSPKKCPTCNMELRKKYLL